MQDDNNWNLFPSFFVLRQEHIFVWDFLCDDEKKIIIKCQNLNGIFQLDF